MAQTFLVVLFFRGYSEGMVVSCGGGGGGGKRVVAARFGSPVWGLVFGLDGLLRNVGSEDVGAVTHNDSLLAVIADLSQRDAVTIVEPV